MTYNNLATTMKIELNDPRITAFAIGELTGDDAIELARVVCSDGRIAKAVEEARDTARLVREIMSPDGATMLTREQLIAVRSAGSSPVISEIASSTRISFWRKPAVSAVGIAAAVALVLFIVGGKKIEDSTSAENKTPKWEWINADTICLMLPVSIDSETIKNRGQISDAVRAVSAAMSNDTEGFRKTVRQRIESIEMKAVDDLPDLDVKDWQDVSVSQKIMVPVASGVASWPWIERHITYSGVLPSRRVVRIEEMINHFTYSKPKMLSNGKVTASIELCQTPWNPQTQLLAVHVHALPGAEVSEAVASLVVNSEHVKRLRLLGYANTLTEEGKEPTTHAPMLASRTRGNYVIYELLMDNKKADLLDHSSVALTLGGDNKLTTERPKAWIEVSHDMRFASMIAAMGMILSDYPTSGILDADQLTEMVDVIEKTDGASLVEERKKGINLVRKALQIMQKSP